MSTQHIEEETLDRYAMGSLAGESIVEVEEHLLVCQFCQNRLSGADEFLALFRAAAVQADAMPVPRWKGIWARRGIIWASVAAAAAALVIFLNTGALHTARMAPASVVMKALRGPDAAAHIAAGRPHLLIFDATPPRGGFDSEIEVVDTLGKGVLKTRGELKDGRLTAVIGNLGRGRYWVRVYWKRGIRELSAEYGLDVK